MNISELPEIIGDLKHLKSLSVPNNQLKSLPNAISSLTHLHFLSKKKEKIRKK